MGVFVKTLLRVSALTVLLALTSCAHHKKCDGSGYKSQCAMKDGKKECQCEMKKEEVKTEEVKK